MAASVGLPAEQLYFNIERVGNASSASIPLALRDAVRDGVIDRPMRIFAPGFGAGAVAGYAVLRIDPGIVALEAQPPQTTTRGTLEPSAPTSSEDVRKAFGDCAPTAAEGQMKRARAASRLHTPRIVVRRQT
jgi:hypothetical protein